jgi:ADP-ribosylglycohydrolase
MEKQMSKSNSQMDLARGCLLGALIGDAVGARLEFLGHQPSMEDVEEALTMPGGGVWRVAPGQVTDDGELTLALAQALAGQRKYSAQGVARNYVRWYRSSPFDMGGTTSNALGGMVPTQAGLAASILKQSETYNQESKANGGLMRQSGLGIWCANVSRQEAIEAARLDSQLTHPNLSCQWASVAYVMAIRHLLLNPGQNVQAFEAAWDSVSAESDDGAAEVRDWLTDAKDGKLPAFHPQAGFVRIAFIHAFFHLLHGSSYLEGLRSTIAGGGDTDTNACIVGGLLGALHGYSALPTPMVQTLLNCDTEKGRPRPLWLQVNSALELADALVAAAQRATALTEEDALHAYARMMNTLDVSHLEALLDDDFHYASQWVFAEIESKSAYLEYIVPKLNAIRNSGSAAWAEMGSLDREFPGPCVVMAQGDKDKLMAVVLAKVENGKIKRLDLCGAPSPHDANRTGIYLGTEMSAGLDV